MKSLSRSSRATGPKMRFPFGLLFASMTTPRCRRSGYGAVRPAILLGGAHHHRLLDPALLDGGVGSASFTDDDDVADPRVLAARAAQHLDALISFAPLLSATFRSVFICIMAALA